jgi:hypothetical protein
MARDKDKYQYLLIGLLKESDGLKWLLEDARQHHMEDQLAKLAAIRLTEFYEQQHGRLIPLRIQAMGVVTSGETSALPAQLPSESTSPAAGESQESETARSDAVKYTGGELDENDKRLSVWEM